MSDDPARNKLDIARIGGLPIHLSHDKLVIRRENQPVNRYHPAFVALRKTAMLAIDEMSEIRPLQRHAQFILRLLHLLDGKDITPVKGMTSFSQGRPIEINGILNRYREIHLLF